MRYAIIPAAGLATRFLPASKSIPKELFPILDKPVIQYIVEEAEESGIKLIIFVSSSGKEAVLDHFDKIDPKFPLAKLKEGIREEILRLDEMVEVLSVRQKSPLGLGHAVLKGSLAVPPRESFAVLLPDMLLVSKNDSSAMKKMAELHEKYGLSVVALMRVDEKSKGMYGIAEGRFVEKNIIKIDRLFEKPTSGETASNLAIVGRYIFTPAIAKLLEETPAGKNGEIQLTDAIVKLLAEEEVLGFIIDDETMIFDTGNAEGFVLANCCAALRKIPDFDNKISKLIKENAPSEGEERAKKN